MTIPVRSLYAVDPHTQRVQLVVQVTPEGWADGSELEDALCSMIPVLDNGAVNMALLVGPENTSVIRRNEQSRQFEVDEITTQEALSPLEVPDDRAALFTAMETWIRRVASDWRQFVPDTSLPKRVPEIVPLIVGSDIRVRDGSIGLTDTTGVEPQTDGG